VGHFERKFQTEGGVAHHLLSVSENYRVIAFRAVSKYPQCIIWFCHKVRLWQTERYRRTDGRTELRL